MRMRTVKLLLTLGLTLWASTAHAQLNPTNGVWVPAPACSDSGETPLNNPSWDGALQNLSCKLGNGVEWLKDPSTGGPARWEWKSWASLPLSNWGGTSSLYHTHSMTYSGDAIGLASAKTDDFTTLGHIAWSAPPDGGPNTSAILVRYIEPEMGADYTITTRYGAFFEDLPDGPIGPPSWAPRDADYNDRGILWFTKVQLACDAIIAYLENLLNVARGVR